MTNNKLVVLYSGMGGSTLGFLQNGYEVHKAYDNDPEAHKTWGSNAHLGLVNHTLVDLTNEEYKDAVHVDTLLASPMCSTSSPINPEGKEESGDVLAALSIIRGLAAYTPNRFVLDTITRYPEVCREAWKILINGLIENNYLFETWKLNAKHYSIPQHRERLFLVARRNSFIGWRIPQRDNKSPGWYASLEDLIPRLETFELKHEKSVKVENKIRKAECNQEISPWYLVAHSGAQTTWRPRPMWDVAPTIKSLRMSRASLGQLVLVNRKDFSTGYRLTPRAYARLQGIPDEYVLFDEYIMGSLIGNAVPTPLMSEIAKSISNPL